MNIDTRLATGTQIFIWRIQKLNIQIKEKEEKLYSNGIYLTYFVLFVNNKILR